jgi:hypothetical protein
MKRLFVVAAATAALAFAATAGAALVPGVYDPGNTGCPVATFANGVLHLEKNCPTPTNAAAGADITGFSGQTFNSGAFTLSGGTVCNGGSPRFDVQTSTGLFFLGCNNVNPVTNGDGSRTYTFTPATLAAAGNQVPFPTGTIQAIDVLIDVQGTADMSNIRVNGVLQVPLVGPPTSKAQCMKGGWKTFNNPAFKNQGQCVSYVASHGKKQHNKPHTLKPKHHH